MRPQVELHSICSQSDLIRYIHGTLFPKHCATNARLEKMRNMEISLMGHREHALISVGAKQSVLKTLFQMSAHNVDCLAVLNSLGDVVAEFTIQNLRKIDVTKFKSLKQPVGEWLEQNSPESFHLNVVSNRISFGQLLETMVNKKVHHLWMTTDSTMRVRGIITLTDIAYTIANFQQLDVINFPKDISQTVLKLP